MKIFLIYLFTGITLCMGLFGQTQDQVRDMWKNPDAYLQEIVSLIVSAPSDPSLNRQLSERMQGLAFAIHADILQAESIDWAHPSSERIAVIEKWGRTLEPYMPKLVELAFSDPGFRSTTSDQAFSLLDYAAPTEKLGEEVRKYLIVKEPVRFTQAEKLLMEHRLTTDHDRKIYHEFQKANNPDDEISVYVSSLYSKSIADQRKALLQKALDILKLPVPSSDDEKLLIKHYQIVFMVALYGIQDNEFRAALEKLQAVVPVDFKNLHKCINDSLDCIYGKKDLFRQEAKNGSGYLLVGAEYYQIEKSSSIPAKNPQNVSNNHAANSLTRNVSEQEKFNLKSAPIFASLFVILLLIAWFVSTWTRKVIRRKR